MMKSYDCPSGSILVNLTGQVDFGDLSPDDVEQIHRSLTLISKFKERGELPEDVSKAIDLVIDSGVILPADYFVAGHAAKANRRVAEAFVKRTSFGLSLFETLSLHGLSALLNKRLGWQRDTLQGKLMKALATITMMFSGVDDAVLIPKQAVLDTLQYFRTTDNLRWRPGMLGDLSP